MIRFLKFVLVSNMTTVKYYGAAWCAPCKAAKPEVLKLCKNFSISLEVYDYDELDAEESATITKLPTVQIWSDEQKVAEYTANQVAQLEKWLTDHVRVIPNDDF